MLFLRNDKFGKCFELFLAKGKIKQFSLIFVSSGFYRFPPCDNYLDSSVSRGEDA
jgi:hypothetical protein